MACSTVRAIVREYALVVLDAVSAVQQQVRSVTLDFSRVSTLHLLRRCGVVSNCVLAHALK
jgi:hypothetical protein